jgi:hypothetical protein
MDADELRTLMMMHVQTVIAGAVLGGAIDNDRAIAALNVTPEQFAGLLQLVRASGRDFCEAIERGGIHYGVAMATAAYVGACIRQEETRRAN